MSAEFPAEVFPPGEFIRDEMESRDWSSSDLARRLGWSDQDVHEVFSGQRPISLDMAQALGETFEVDPEFWMNLERAYRLSQSRIESGKQAFG